MVESDLARSVSECGHILGSTERLLQPVIGTRNHVCFCAATCTGMMEAALVNVLARGERVLVVIHGQFGERFAAIAQAMGARADTVETEWGGAPDAEAIEARLRTGDYRAVIMVHNESSTGAFAPLSE